MDEPRHVSVLLDECIEMLNIRPDGIYVDGTLGLGGHSYEIAKRLKGGRLIGIDRDASALERAGKRLAGFAGSVTLVRVAFSINALFPMLVTPFSTTTFLTSSCAQGAGASQL